MNKIKLNTRYGYKTYLEKREKDYVLKTDSLMIREEFDKDHKIIFIDPSGGPMLKVNSFIEEMNEVINKIDFIKGIGYVLTMK